MQLRYLVLSTLLLVAGCQTARSDLVQHVSLRGGQGDAGRPGFRALRDAFVNNNPGYDLAFHAGVRALVPAACDRVVFVQDPDSQGDIRFLPPMGHMPPDDEHYPFACGDLLLLRAGQPWRSPVGACVDLLAFSLPRPLPAGLPPFVQPDWDPKITDTPGGCATEGDAYRRILLTWKPEVGPYIMHQLNAHRVRINDSFSHYHPVATGFDEFYLVQQAPPGARLLTSDHTAAIESRKVDADMASTLLESRALQVGDLVYMPRGTVHRGLGGALVQVISVPGFVPKSEVGVDHHLWAINRKLGLRGDDAIPFHLVAARTAVVK